MTPLEYWTDLVSESAENAGATLTTQQIEAIAADVKIGHECYGEAFYSPPATERLSQIESEHKKQIASLRKELHTYQQNATDAVRRLTGLGDDTNISINAGGEVLLHGGRTERIA